MCTYNPITESLKYVYKANQCTDLNDVEFAISEVKRISKEWHYTDALRKRLNSLEKRQEVLENRINKSLGC